MTPTIDRLNAAADALRGLNVPATSDGTLISEVGAFDDAVRAAQLSVSVARALIYGPVKPEGSMPGGGVRGS